MKKIMVANDIFGSTLVEVLVSMILVGILMISATRFFVVAWRLDAEQQEYYAILNSIANIIEIGINNRAIYDITSGGTVNLNNSNIKNRVDSFRGSYFDYKDSVYNVIGINDSSLGVRCHYLVCKLMKKEDFGLGALVLKTAYYKKWDMEI